MFFNYNVVQVVKIDTNQCPNDNKGHHLATCSSNTGARKRMHEFILNTIMDLLKLANFNADKEPTHVLNRQGNRGEILVPDDYIKNNPLIPDHSDTAFDLYVVHPDVDPVNSTVSYSLSRKTNQKIAKYGNSIEIINNSIIFKPIGCDLYGELSLEFTNFIDSIIAFGSTFKNIRPSVFSNRFYNNLAFTFT
jgi:hypothetical protein